MLGLTLSTLVWLVIIVAVSVWLIKSSKTKFIGKKKDSADIIEAKFKAEIEKYTSTLSEEKKKKIDSITK